jgi:N-acetylglucosaminyldiphosphoundecaprenol N-acetyl-beta-D-mannosaminyltransferase
MKLDDIPRTWGSKAHTSAESSAGRARSPDLPEIQLQGVRFHAVTEERAIRFILDELDAGRGGWVVTHNLDHLRRRLRDPSFAEICADATLIVADGMPLVWASRLQHTPVPERVAGSNLTVSLSAAAAAHGRSVYLLGGAPGSAKVAAASLKARHPKLLVAGTYCPPMGFEDNPEEMQRLRALLVAATPDIVLVALGSPKQERLIRELRTDLPGTWWLGVGISLSFVSGQIRRAPPWMQRSGLEWVHRLAQEPQRLGKRYLVDGIPFAMQLLAESAWQRLRGTTGTGPASTRGGRPVASAESEPRGFVRNPESKSQSDRLPKVS